MCVVAKSQDKIEVRFVTADIELVQVRILRSIFSTCDFNRAKPMSLSLATIRLYQWRRFALDQRLNTCAFLLEQNRGQIRDRRHRISLDEDSQLKPSSKFHYRGHYKGHYRGNYIVYFTFRNQQAGCQNQKFSKFARENPLRILTQINSMSAVTNLTSILS